MWLIVMHFHSLKRDSSSDVLPFNHVHMLTCALTYLANHSLPLPFSPLHSSPKRAFSSWSKSSLWKHGPKTHYRVCGKTVSTQLALLITYNIRLILLFRNVLCSTKNLTWEVSVSHSTELHMDIKSETKKTIMHQWAAYTVCSSSSLLRVAHAQKWENGGG